MSQSETIVQKHFKLGGFYKQFSSEIEGLYTRASHQNPCYHPQNANGLLQNQCKSDAEHVNVLALYAKTYEDETLIAFFAYETQNKRWVLPIRCFISWWDDLIDDNSPLIDKNYMAIATSLLTQFLKTEQAYFLMHQGFDEAFMQATKPKTVHINAIYSNSKLQFKLILNCNKANNFNSLVEKKYIIFAETFRIKIRDILNKKN